MAVASEPIASSTPLRILAAFSLSFRRFARSKFMIGNLLLGSIPVFIALVLVIFGGDELGEKIGDVHNVYELLLRSLFLHFIVFFLATTIGFSVMRQESEDQTLHYLLLQPASRWMLVVGKFLAYLGIVSATSIAALWLTYLIMAVGMFGIGVTVTDLFSGGRFVILMKESGVLVLGLTIYGGVALMMGSFFKSAFYALLLLVWESVLLPFLPATLKLWTATHYLHSLLPERVMRERRLLELLGDPASVGLSLSVLIGASLIFIGIAIALFQGKECLYSDA